MVNVCKSLSLPEDRSGRCSSEGQGIRVVLEKESLTGSLRRTLSANMSACPPPSALLLRRSASCEHFLGLSSEQEQEHEREHNQNEDQEQEQDFWSLVHNEQSPPPPSDAFSALIALKEGGDGSQSPFETYKKPYIHPNVKRRHKLSDKSLQLCTEGLGSETGSDCSLSDSYFSASSDEEDDEKAEEEEEQNNWHSMGADSDYNGLIISSGVSKRSEYLHVCDGPLSVQNSGNAVAASSLPHGSRKSPSRCFPPPLPSLSKANGSSVTMKSVKEDGRFMLKAVTVSASQKCLRAHRQQGRLQLHFVASLSLQNDVNIAAHPAVAEAEAEAEVEKCAKRDRCDEDADEVTSSSPDIRQYNNGKSQGDIPLLNKHVPDSCRYRPPSASVPFPADADANHSLKFKHGDLINSSIIDVGCKKKRIQQQEAAKSKEWPSPRASSGSSTLNVYEGWRRAAAAGSTNMFGYPASLLEIYSHNNKSDSPVRLNECAHSLPDFSVHKSSFGASRCKDRRKLPSNFKPYSVAIS